MTEDQPKMSTQAELAAQVASLQEQVDRLERTGDQLARDNARLCSLDNILLQKLREIVPDVEYRAETARKQAEQAEQYLVTLTEWIDELDRKEMEQ